MNAGTGHDGGHGRNPRMFEALVGNDVLRDDVGRRIARWIARESEKESARAFGVSPRTVKSWRAGHLPQMRHLMAMAGRWGEAFLDDVFAPVLVHDAPLTTRLERLEAEIAAIRREVSQIDDAEPGPAESPAGGPTEAGTNGRTLPEPKRWESFRDDSRNRVEVAWYDVDAVEFDGEEMRTFARMMGSVAGRPPSWESLSAEERSLTSIHLVDVTANAPDEYSFRHLGWTGIDMSGITRLGSIPAEALRINAQHSYLDVKVFGEPSYSLVSRRLASGDNLSYSRLIWPALSGDRNQLLWVGIRSEQRL